METVAAKLPKALVEGIDRVVRRGRFSNRSEVVRAAVRAFVGGGGERPDVATPERPAGRSHEARIRTIRALAADLQYRDRFVALHGSRVLDHDEDLQSLVGRVLSRPEAPIYIERVTEGGGPATVHMPGARVRRP